MTELDVKVTVPMMADDRKRLRQTALDLDISPGLLARSLILAGLDDIDSPALESWISAEAARAQLRWSKAGRTAIAARHAKTQKPEGGDRNGPV